MNNPLRRIFYLYLSLLLAGATLQAQHFTVDVIPILVDQNGINYVGSITLDFDNDFFEDYDFKLTTISQPGIGENCAILYDFDPINGEPYPIAVSSVFGGGCAGNYCYTVSQVDMETFDVLCEVEFCVYVDYCQAYANEHGTVWSCNTVIGPGGDNEVFMQQPDDPGGQKAIASDRTPQKEQSESPPVADEKTRTLIPEIVRIYPVPFSSELHVKIKTTSEGPIQLKLLDMYGRTLLLENHDIHPGFHIFTLTPRQDLPDGMYYLQITDDQGRQTTKGITHVNN